MRVEGSTVRAVGGVEGGGRVARGARDEGGGGSLAYGSGFRVEG